METAPLVRGVPTKAQREGNPVAAVYLERPPKFNEGMVAVSSQAASSHVAKRNAALFKALSHPFRERIMILLTEREASPSQIAEELGEPLDNTSYHVRELESADLIELVRIAPGRRGTQKVYKASARPIMEIESWERLPRLLREINSVWVAQLMVGDLVEAIKAGTFDHRPGRTMLRVPGLVDEQGWDELEPAAMRYLHETYDIMARSSERLAESGAEGINVCISTIATELPPPVTEGALA
jgi:DNA-binding transcriptional ArsR family regulator